MLLFINHVGPHCARCCIMPETVPAPKSSQRAAGHWLSWGIRNFIWGGALVEAGTPGGQLQSSLPNVMICQKTCEGSLRACPGFLGVVLGRCHVVRRPGQNSAKHWCEQH